MTVWKNAWRMVSESVGRYLNEDQEERMKKIISLSYNKLSLYLKPSFLHLGMVPENFDIAVQKMILMWVAEGFIWSKPGISFVEITDDYLEDLVNRNLV